jgi:hypothetical protein
MSDKELVLNAVSNLPNNVSYDEIIHSLYIRAKFENGIEQIKSGNGISNE